MRKRGIDLSELYQVLLLLQFLLPLLILLYFTKYSYNVYVEEYLEFGPSLLNNPSCTVYYGISRSESPEAVFNGNVLFGRVSTSVYRSSLAKDIISYTQVNYGDRPQEARSHLRKPVDSRIAYIQHFGTPEESQVSEEEYFSQKLDAGSEVSDAPLGGIGLAPTTGLSSSVLSIMEKIRPHQTATEDVAADREPGDHEIELDGEEKEDVAAIPLA